MLVPTVPCSDDDIEKKEEDGAHTHTHEMHNIIEYILYIIYTKYTPLVVYTYSTAYMYAMCEVYIIYISIGRYAHTHTSNGALYIIYLAHAHNSNRTDFSQVFLRFGSHVISNHMVAVWQPVG